MADHAIRRRGRRGGLLDPAAVEYHLEYAGMLIASGGREAARQALDTARGANPPPAARAPRIKALSVGLR